MNLNKIIQIIEKKTFLYYNDINNHTLYIPRFVYEECKLHKIDFESKAKVLFDRNYYTIPRDKLKELEDKSNYKGIEKILHFEKEKKSSKLDNVIFAFKDGLTNLTYIPIKYTENTSGNTKTILNQKCRIIHINDLEKIYNKKIYVITVFLKPEEPEEILLCRSNDKLFIKELDAVTFGLNLANRKKIRVNGIFYLEISQEETFLMSIIATKEDRKITFAEKNIVPKREKL